MASITESALRRFKSLEPFPLPSVIPLRYPVVMMHGFGLLAGMRRGGHFFEAAAHLRQRGIRAYAPNVAPYNTVEVRCEMWRRRFDQVFDETRAEKLNLIAHSMGGLDARYMISSEGYAGRVASLTTIATPHRGSSLAHFILDQPDRLRRWLTDVANWMGSQVVEDSVADFRTAVAELTPESIHDRFEAGMADDPTVRYWSFAGTAGKGTDNPVNPFLRVFNTYIYEREGPNDGMVSAKSAAWGHYLGEIPADHGQQVGIAFPGSSKFVHTEFYVRIADLLADNGF